MLLSSSCLIFMSHHDVICFLAWLKHFVWTWSHQDPSVSVHRATNYNKLKHVHFPVATFTILWCPSLQKAYVICRFKLHLFAHKFFSSFRTTPSIVTCSNDKLEVLCRKNVINKRDFVVSMFKLWHFTIIAHDCQLENPEVQYMRSKCMQNLIDHMWCDLG